MDPEVLALFHELADRSPSERDGYYAKRRVPAAVRTEVESLLRFDGTSEPSLSPYVAAVAHSALLEDDGISLAGRYGSYRPIRLIGRGGMGAVYEAEQESPRRIVALKVIRPGLAGPDLVRRFEQEAQALGRLQHPGIAQIHEAGTSDTGFGLQPYFAMELVRGAPLLQYSDSHRLGTRQRLELIARMCDAVEHAHQRGIIHRDLKPANILVDETDQPKILDFGVARVTDSDVHATRHTDVGQLVGTLAYMSPEQVSADPLELDTRSDVYALGVILYELLAGRPPYNTTGRLHDLVHAIRVQDPTPLGTINRACRGDVEIIVAKALEKDKGRRYGSAAALAGDIRRYLHDEPLVARPPSLVYQIQKFAKRHTALVAGVAAVFLALVSGVVVSTWQATRALRAEQAAVLALNRARTAEYESARERDRAIGAGVQADEERNRAVEEKRRADTEAAAARAISEFLQNDLLAQAGASTQAAPNTRPDPDLRVRTALDRAAERIAGKFAKQPLVEASVRQTIGLAYRELGVYPEAQRQFELVYDLRRRASGERNAATLSVMNHLGQLHRLQGRLAQAEPLLIRTLDMQRRLLGEQHPDTLDTMASLAIVYTEQRKDVQAEAIITRILDIRRRLLGEEHLSTLTIMNNLALLHMRQGKYGQAETGFKKVMEIRTRRLGEEHPETLTAMNNLALVYFYQGKNQQAEEGTARAMELRQRVLGDEHPSTLNSIQNLAAFRAHRGKYDEAEPLFLKVLETQRRLVGDEHTDTLMTMRNLGELYLRQEKYALAEALLSRAQDGRRRVLGDEHPETLTSMDLTAQLLHSEGKTAQAEALFSKVLELRRRVLGPLHPQTLASMASLGELWLQQQKYGEAEAVLREAMSGRERATPLAWERYKVESLLGTVLAEQEKYAAAEPLLRSGYQGLIQRELSIPASEQSLLRRTRDRIGQLYENWGRPEKTAEWRATR